MSSLGRYWRAALVLGGLGSGLTASAQAPPELTQAVRLTPGRRSLGAVLAELSRQSRLPFSYSSSLVPLAHRYQVRPGPPRPAGVVLREVLASEHLTYGWLAGQVVLWPDRAPAPPGVTAVNGGIDATGLASTGKGQAEPAARPVAKAVPGLPPGAQPQPSPVAARAAGRPAASPPLGGNAGFGSTTLSARLAAAPKTSATVNRPSAAPGSRLVPPPARRKPLASQAAAATISPTSTGITAAAGFRPGHGAHFRVGEQAGGAPARASQPTAFTRAKTPYSAAANVRSLAQLPPKLVGLEPVNQAGPLPRTLSSPTGVAVAPVAPAADRPLNPGTSQKGLCLHGEAWASESLPLGAVAKVGVARAYLVLGGAVALSEHHLGGAWGVGLGTVGRARGRFTPSLDVMHWFLGHDGDEGTGPTHLTQLRPLLAWQLRREGRWALLLGPTLNLATADSHGAQRGNFGHNQWLLVDKDGERSSVRFWPGVQVGLRF